MDRKEIHQPRDRKPTDSTHTKTDTDEPSRSRHHKPSTQDNRQRLGVNQEHKTETMRRRHRGTFP